ncbi:hypothetical protein HCC30_27585 [Streptomyces sp. HNM0574]|nr:hypothetical protein [Streptomyces sp. HNM0574]
MLVGGLAFLLGFTVLTWTATGLAGLFSHGAWPTGVTFARTPAALRALATEPHDLAGAWPGTPSGQLSGYGLFWGLVLGQLLVAVVLTVFVLGTVARARAVHAARKAERAREPEPANPLHKPEPEPQPEPVPEPRPEPAASPQVPLTAPPVAAPAHQPAPADPYARVREAPGAALVATRDPELWAATKDARAKLGPVHVFDPTHRCDTPARIRWSPHHGCTDRATAAARATALLEPLRGWRPPRPVDADVHTAAETLLRCWLHAAALDNRPFREVHRWAQASGSNASGPVRILRTHPEAGAGTAGELEATLTGHPERRRAATELVRRALAPLTRLHVRDACTAGRADRVALASFPAETGTLYVVGDDPEIMPLLNALARAVADEARSATAPRLDPPLTEIDDLRTPS